MGIVTSIWILFEGHNFLGALILVFFCLLRLFIRFDLSLISLTRRLGHVYNVEQPLVVLVQDDLHTTESHLLIHTDGF